MYKIHRKIATFPSCSSDNLRTRSRTRNMSHDPIHDWFDAAFRKVRGDRKAFKRMKKKRNARTQEWRDSTHGDDGKVWGRAGASEFETIWGESQPASSGLRIIRGHNTNASPGSQLDPYSQQSEIGGLTSGFDLRTVHGHDPNGTSGYPRSSSRRRQSGPLREQGVQDQEIKSATQ